MEFFEIKFDETFVSQAQKPVQLNSVQSRTCLRTNTSTSFGDPAYPFKKAYWDTMARIRHLF